MIVKLQYPLSSGWKVLAYNEDRSFIADIPIRMFKGLKLGGISMIPLMIHRQKIYVEATVDGNGQLVISRLMEEDPDW